WPKLPVSFSTGHAETSGAGGGAERVRVLQKPYEIGALLQSIADVTKEKLMTMMVAVANETFVVPCTACLRMYDALSAPWCDCIGDEQTLRCPYCRRCFCRAATEYKTEFWRVAPEDLHDQRRKSVGGKARDRFTTMSGELPTEIARPMVLVVDDSKLIRMTTMRIVRALGYGAIEAADADQALALTLLYRPEVVLSDALMPKVDGRDMCRTIKTSP